MADDAINNGAGYSDDDIALMRAFAGIVPMREIALALGRTVPATRQMARALNIGLRVGSNRAPHATRSARRAPIERHIVSVGGCSCGTDCGWA